MGGVDKNAGKSAKTIDLRTTTNYDEEEESRAKESSIKYDRASAHQSK